MIVIVMMKTMVKETMTILVTVNKRRMTMIVMVTALKLLLSQALHQQPINNMQIDWYSQDMDFTNDTFVKFKVNMSMELFR